VADRLHLAVALDGAGWHPAAWRHDEARPDALFDADYWVDLVRTAERGALDFATFEDALTLQSAHPWRPDDRVDQVRGRLDAALLANRVAPATTRIGLVPTMTTTHTEPFNVANRIASLDHVSGGRAGWRVQVLKQQAEIDHFGRRPELATDRSSGSPDDRAAAAQPLFEEAADAIEVARRLWDSWEDDAEIRDRATGRFIDRTKLHPIDFEGAYFSVRGPSITPRPPQGHPVVTVLAHVPVAYRLAARGADLVFVTPKTMDDVFAIAAQVRQTEADVGRVGPPLLLFADLVVLVEDEPDGAQAELDRLDELDQTTFRSDARILATSPSRLADLLVRWHGAGLDGFRLRPARLPVDLDAIVDTVVPQLLRRGLFVDGYESGSTLRGRLGLDRPDNRYRTGGEAVGS
jgi:alkanesulfonate monooxygenase SsuD/methylene tetrahydromethanopterin reductase-like flavin-dependent oxidoreductase (luciferase family)